MPKVYISQKQKDAEKIKAVIRRRMKSSGKNGCDMAPVLGITHQGYSYKLNQASFTLLDLLCMHRVLNFSIDDIAELLDIKRDEANERYFREIIHRLKQMEGGQNQNGVVYQDPVFPAKAETPSGDPQLDKASAGYCAEGT